MTYLLDTNICIALINRTDVALAKRFLAQRPTDVVMCSVVRAELEFGARNSTRVAENLARMSRFWGSLASLPFDDAAATHYGDVRAHFRRVGTAIGVHDLQIASIALAHDLTVVTRNLRELRRVPGLTAEAW